VIPVVQLLVLAAAAGLAGIMAAIEPSRRAARLDVLRAIYHRVNANREGSPSPA
jgi:ABC-type lipoprotein release transport system permease subunit